jgi:CubicO group peptidase (beta-lactamase class C family)
LFKNQPLNFAPGEKYEYSNSNYNLLAFVIEKVSGKSYGEFLRESILAPLALANTGHDGDETAIVANAAAGYQPRGVAELEKAPFLVWSAKTGNGSLYSTTGDLLKFVRAYAQGRVVKAETVTRIWSEHRGNSFGWFARKSHGQLAVAANGRSPGFTSSVEYYPAWQLTVIVLSNSYSPVSQSPVADDLAAIALGEPIAPAGKVLPEPLSATELAKVAGAYRFGPDFYRRNAEVNLRVENGDAVLDWGGGSRSVLIPVGAGEFLDRQFWGRIKINADGNGFTYSTSGQDFQVKRTR